MRAAREQTLIKLEKTSFLGWCQATGSWELEVVKRPSGARGRSRQP
ncbi:MAG: hypothetical protein ACLQUY_10665 [Ktedonobacterales bacterium]